MPKGKTRRSISRRWFVNTISIVLLVLVIFIVTLSSMVRSSTYTGIEQALTGRVDELLNWLSSGGSSASEFNAITRDYIERFPDKNEMEIMALSRSGKIVTTSTGFEPDQTQKMPDYEEALQSDDNAGKWIGELDTGEKVMAITRVVRDSGGAVVGSVRYLVSLERADLQTSRIILFLIAAGLFIMLLIVLSGMYFIRSILRPVRQVSAGAELIAKGDFTIRIPKYRDDELGQLCDSINDMAGELAATERMKNDFISSVSHELRTPLTAIKGWAETLQYGADEQTTDKGMGVIIRESERLSGLVEELLDFSRLQSGRMKLLVQRVDILSELDEAVYLFTERACTEQKKLHYDPPLSLNAVYGDANRLRQAIVSILDNALKYTEQGGSITVSAQHSDEAVTISIKDTGCGIAPEDLPNVKKKFYKANQLVRGSGIGLAVADEIISLHGGTLQLESELGVGTEVTVTLLTCQSAEQHPELIETPELQKVIQERIDEHDK